MQLLEKNQEERKSSSVLTPVAEWVYGTCTGKQKSRSRPHSEGV